ncbi:MAG: glutamate-5-semialdehyde dehydrogenase [Candidatus Omnitrophica bacterium]|nr:glutamate-5-semialdehyde dehydrogenase [Candidatus Omnitrophota bacterium]
MAIKEELTSIANRAQDASRSMTTVSTASKNKVLKSMALVLISKKSSILKANKKDIKKARAARLSSAFIDRLALNTKRIKEMSDSLLEITKLNDPVGEVIKAWRRPNGLWIHKVRVPIGVIAIIYESRPNVTADCIGLCFKSGNSVILRGGSEALNSNLAIYQMLKEVIKKSGLSQDLVNMVTTVNRQAVDILLKLNNYIDLVIPRGGEGLINQVMKSSRIPIIKHYKGICHVYVDEWADLNMAQNLCFNAKVQRPGVCNAMESMLVHKDIAAIFLPGMIKKFKEADVEIRGCSMTGKIAKGVKKANEKDYFSEYLDLILSVKVVNDLREAIRHINYYGSHHSDTIVTDNYENALEFLRLVDSACVYVNASTRFTDGNQFGMGAEIGISTDKLHARGPMGLEELTTYKYIIFGNGQVRS